MKDPFKLCGRAMLIVFCIIFSLSIIVCALDSMIFFYIYCGVSLAIVLVLCVYVFINWRCPYCKQVLPMALMEFCPYCGKRIHYKDDDSGK